MPGAGAVPRLTCPEIVISPGAPKVIVAVPEAPLSGRKRIVYVPVEGSPAVGKLYVLNEWGDDAKMVPSGLRMYP